MIARTFYNEKAFPSTIYVVLHDREVDSWISKDNVTKLLDQAGDVIGYNIFDENFKSEKSGYLKMDYELLRFINNHIFSAFQEEIIHDFNNYIVVGYVETCEPHPDSDHLSICQVCISNEKKLQIVCGASNVKAGIKVVVCLENAVLADGTLIRNGKLRGVESQGMLANAKELGLNDEGKQGIIIVDESYSIGDAFKE